MYRQELKKKNKEFRKERAAMKSKKLKEEDMDICFFIYIHKKQKNLTYK